jgi:hypothetical protein
MQLRRWLKRARGLAASGALALIVLAPVVARADGSDEPPRRSERVVKIGPQAVVIENARTGEVRMYDDPSQEQRACKSRASCWGNALTMLSWFGLMTYEDLTQGVEGGGRTVERPSFPVE